LRILFGDAHRVGLTEPERGTSDATERNAKHDDALHTPNENKMSDGGRGRASLGVEVWKSSQKWSIQRSAVRSIAWLDRLVDACLSGHYDPLLNLPFPAITPNLELISLNCVNKVCAGRVMIEVIIERDCGISSATHRLRKLRHDLARHSPRAGMRDRATAREY
jgi:hypothetical protein